MTGEDDRPQQDRNVATYVAAGVVAVSVAGAPGAAHPYEINAYSTVRIADWNVCYTVTNNASSILHVFTASSGEWSSFYNHPGSASVSYCGTGDAGGNADGGFTGDAGVGGGG